MTFGRLTDFIENARALKLNSALSVIFGESEIQEEIIFLNTFEQLFEGVNASGIELSSIGGEYSNFTLEAKIRRGLPLHVTLYYTGEFYDSFTVKAGADSFEIEADTIKRGQDLQDRWGDNLLGLTDESREALLLVLLPKLREYILLKLL